MKVHSKWDRLAFIVMLGALFGTGALTGVVATHRDWFAVPRLVDAWRDLVKLSEEFEPKWFVSHPAASQPVQTFGSGSVAPGLILVDGAADRDRGGE